MTLKLNDSVMYRHGFSLLNSTLGAHARASVKSHLTSGASVRLENAVTYSTGKEGQKFSLKWLCSRVMA